MAEWSNAADSKSVDRLVRAGGSNPPLSAIKADRHFSAQVLYQIERIKDINDEMVAQIRRSKFVVADLTGYHGGVYCEAEFTYALGLPVIYTCHEYWREQVKKEDRTTEREDIHFDLGYWNIIFWN